MDRLEERLFWQNLDSETQRRIISAANKNILCRMIIIVYLAGFLFCCHIRRYLLTDPKRKIACILSSVLLFFYVTANQAALVVKGEAAGYQEGIQLEGVQKGNENLPDAGHEQVQPQDSEQEETPQIDVDVIVTEPEEDIVEGYEERPVYQVQITNSGTDVLNHIILQSQTADVFMLYKEVEVPVYHPQEEDPDEAEKNDDTEDVEDDQDTEDAESGNTETSEDGLPADADQQERSHEPADEAAADQIEESAGSGSMGADIAQTEQEQPSDAEQLFAEIPTVLEPGQSLTYTIHMPLALLTGEHTELLSFYAEELDGPVEILLCLKVLEDSSGHDSDKENPNGGTDSEKQEGGIQNSENAEVESPGSETASEGTETESSEIETGSEETETESPETETGSEETETESPEIETGSEETEAESPETETGSEETETESPETETGSEEMETESSELERGSEEAETTFQEPATDSEEEGMDSPKPEADILEPETGSEGITAGEETNSGEAGEVEAKEPQDDILLPTVEVTAREGGYYMGNTFFVTAASNFEVKATNAHVLSNGSIVYGSPIKAVFCEINGTIQELEIRDGSAIVVLPESYHGVIKFYALDESGRYSNEIREYVISEKNVPTVNYAKVVSSTDGSEQIRVTLKDSGEIISGISEAECYIDGKQYTEYKTEVFEKKMLSGGMEVSSGIFFDIPLTDHEVHTIEVFVTDYTGNSFVKVFRVCGATQRDVVSVVLPTRFGMEIFPSAANGNIFGEDIVIANQSDFPVEVTLAAANVGIDHELPDNRILTSELAVGNNFEQPFDLTKLQNMVEKDAALNLNLKKVDGDESVFALREGTNSNVVHFTLQPKNPDTNAAALQRDQNGGSVSSSDYAIVNIRGEISEGSDRMWKDGDITVSLTFTFRKSEENE